MSSRPAKSQLEALLCVFIRWVYLSCNLIITAEMGAHHMHVQLLARSALCWNTPVYRFSLAFFNIFASVTYPECYSRFLARHTPSDLNFMSDRLPVLRSLDLSLLLFLSNLRKIQPSDSRTHPCQACPRQTVTFQTSRSTSSHFCRMPRI
jgi:hypothetical protein